VLKVEFGRQKHKMSKVLKTALTAVTKIAPNNCSTVAGASKLFGASANIKCLSNPTSAHGLLSHFSRTYSSFSSLCCLRYDNLVKCQRLSGSTFRKTNAAFYSSEVDKEISSFLAKEIQYEVSRAVNDLPKIRGFEMETIGGDVTLTKTINKEKIVVRLSVNGAVDSVANPDDAPNENEPPQMVCRPPFEVEMSKENGVFLALQCAFPSAEEPLEDAQQNQDQIEDQFEIQEVAFHNGEWKDTTYAVSAATMDAELFDLLMDMLDERGINDEFIAELVDYCTSYENKQYIGFLKSLKDFADK